MNDDQDDHEQGRANRHLGDVDMRGLHGIRELLGQLFGHPPVVLDEVGHSTGGNHPG